MKNDNDDYDDDFDDDFDGDIDVDPHEYEIEATSNRRVNWRRIERLREHRMLKNQLTDFDDYLGI